MRQMIFLKFSFFLLSLMTVSISHADEPLTLKRCFELALKQSEAIIISDEAIRRAEGQYREVLGKALPELSFRYSSTWQDQSGLGDLGGLSSFTTSPQPEAAFRLNLPIFSGYRELAAIRAGSSLVEQREYERRHAELLLFLDAAGSYYTALLAGNNLTTLEKILTLTNERLREISERKLVGRSREAELLDIKAKIAALKAQKEDAKFTYEEAKNLLEFLIGEPVGEKLKNAPQSSIGREPKNLDQYLAAIDNRPDIKAKHQALLVAKGGLNTARAGHLPQLDANANYYVDRSGFRDPINWDATLGVTVPLWAWGATQGSVRQAKSLMKQAEADKDLVARRAYLEIKDAYEKYSSSLRKVSLTENARHLARQSYRIRTDEYRKGLINNLEVLDALDRFYQAELEFNAARFGNALNYLKLETSIGTIPEEM